MGSSQAQDGARAQATARGGNSPRGNRTPATGVKGPRADRYTMGPRPPESTRPGGVFLARHGETDYNAERRFQGLLAVPLNAAGRAQAHELASRAAAFGFVELWCSPLARARETADIVGAALALAPQEDARLVETDCGDWTDRTHAEVQAEDPEAYAAFVAAAPEFTAPGGESFHAQTERMMAALREIRQRPRPVLVVTHGMSIRLVFSALGQPLATVANAALLDCSSAASSSGRAPDF
jgi:broad specificity phosphatase PhoE